MLNLKSPTEVMPPATAKIFEEIRENPLLSPFILIGGTALSLHIGHRVSEDLDFITLLPKLPRVALKELQRELEKHGHQVVQNVDPAADDEFQIAGMELADSQQDWVIDGATKLTFFSAETPQIKLLTPFPSETPIRQEDSRGFKIATLEELCRLKATVTASRSNCRKTAFIAGESSCREANRAYSEAEITGAGTRSRMASSTVQRPSPLSST